MLFFELYKIIVNKVNFIGFKGEIAPPCIRPWLQMVLLYYCAPCFCRTMFRYITDEPTHDYGLLHHFRKMRWLTWPRFTAESVSLVLATTIKDILVLHLEAHMEDVSLTDFITGQIAKKYRRG